MTHMIWLFLYDWKDFNYARLITHQELVAYIAPEMLTCKQLFIDRYHPKATDCWALGVILYFMIFYKLPFNDDNSKKVRIVPSRGGQIREPLPIRGLLMAPDPLVQSGKISETIFFSQEDQNKH